MAASFLPPLFDISKDAAPGELVVFVHGPRSSGLSVTLGSLGVLAQHDGRADAAVVLTARSGDVYRHRGYDERLILNRAVPDTVHQILQMQENQMQTLPDTPLPPIAIIVDDMFLPSRLSDAFRHDISRAPQLNVSLLIGTADASRLPTSLETLATHVLATRCLTMAEPATLFKRMFKMLPKAVVLVEMLDILRPYEFLLGIMRPPKGLDGPRLRLYAGQHVVGAPHAGGDVAIAGSGSGCASKAAYGCKAGVATPGLETSAATTKPVKKRSKAENGTRATTSSSSKATKRAEHASRHRDKSRRAVPGADASDSSEDDEDDDDDKVRDTAKARKAAIRARKLEKAARKLRKQQKRERLALAAARSGEAPSTHSHDDVPDIDGPGTSSTVTAVQSTPDDDDDVPEDHGSLYLSDDDGSTLTASHHMMPPASLPARKTVQQAAATSTPRPSSRLDNASVIARVGVAGSHDKDTDSDADNMGSDAQYDTVTESSAGDGDARAHKSKADSSPEDNSGGVFAGARRDSDRVRATARAAPVPVPATVPAKKAAASSRKWYFHSDKALVSRIAAILSNN
jgi:hypothetical protein